jgi:hypothetical protein
MKTFIIQPPYLPWIGFFKAIDYCDNLVFYTDVQFGGKQSWHRRNRIVNIKKIGADFVYLSIPIKKHHLKTKILDIEIGDKKFYVRHLDLIKNNYHGRPYLEEVISLLESVYVQDFVKLFLLNIALIKKLSEYLGLGQQITFFDSVDLGFNGDEKNQRLINICKKLNTDEYFSPVGSKAYLDIPRFNENNIKVSFLDFEHPEYPQTRSPFVSHMSIVDALINIGPDKTREMIKNIKLRGDVE